jgi:hypothetical protein
MDGSQRPTDVRTLPDLVSQLTSDLATLVRKESELIRTELTEKAHTAFKAAGEVAAGGLLMVAVLILLLQALVLALSKFMDPIWATLIVAVLVGGVGFVLIRTGMKMMKPDHLTPDRSARQLQKDAQLMKGRPQ